MATMDFEENFVCWKQVGNKIFALKQPNMIVCWNIDTGKVENG